MIKVIKYCLHFQTGSIKTAKENYLIEPAHEEDQPLMDDKQLHLIYKRSQVDSLFNNTNCGTKGLVVILVM